LRRGQKDKNGQMKCFHPESDARALTIVWAGAGELVEISAPMRGLRQPMGRIQPIMVFSRTAMPREITPAILDFCSKVTGGVPSYVDVRPDPGADFGECYASVDRKIAKDGGEKIYGWWIGEWPRAMLEAQFHCVWKSPSGEMVDIVPKPECKSVKILFLPDPTRRFEGKRIDTRRSALATDMLINEYIVALADAERLTGDKAGWNRVTVTPELQDLMKRFPRLHAQMVKKY
jgi:hypothetical protein